MKNVCKWMIAAILLVSGAATLGAQNAETERAQAYFSVREMPNLVNILPAPPDSIVHKFTYDVAQYMWGKEMRRDPERGPLAVEDAEYSLEYMLKAFKDSFGMEISFEKTPEIYRVLRDSFDTANNMGTVPKVRYMRRRPFMVFNEPTATPDREPSLRRNGSFPSGHTIAGWLTALVLMEINPDAADAIMARGYAYGESRVIVGAHWQSDVDAGYLAASIAYAKIHTSDRFLEQMAKARTEYKRLTGQIVEEPARNARAARRAQRTPARARAN